MGVVVGVWGNYERSEPDDAGMSLLSPLQVYVGVAVFFTSFLVLLRYKLEFSAWVR